MEKTFNAAEEEVAIYAAWESSGAFKAGANAKRDETFSIMIPPPNVTGSLHMGHAFNNTLQDILVRWHRMRGFDVLWQPGQDHAGIATQMVVERELAKAGAPSRQEMGRAAFLKKIWEWKEQSGGKIISQLKRLGASCDWSRNAFTMDENFQQAVIKVFVDMYHKGLIYRGKRLVNWDPYFETAISDLEVENIETDGHFWHFKYPLQDGKSYEYIERDENGDIIFKEMRDYISIATTRPETMLGDGAVAVHPSDERYRPIVGKMVHLPLCDRVIPIITDDYPDPDFGSGAVKITGAHDFNDYAVAKRNGIKFYRLMDTKARMRDDDEPDNFVPQKYRGLERFAARKVIVEDIAAQGLLIRVEDKKITQPFGDRSKVVIEPMLTDQWFVDTDKIVTPAMEAVRKGKTKILPDRDNKVYFQWLKNIEPWCVSRQLWWGHRIPVWFDEEGNEYCAATEKEAQKMAGDKILTRDPDVLDTWFSSGLWPIGTLGWPQDTDALQKYFPTSVLITGFDILFFWVARMMMMQYAVVGQKPFSTVYVHALVRDEKGKKMSKSLGNVLDPLELIDEYGADAVRFSLTAMAAMARDLKLSVSRIQGYRNFGTKLWNATRYAEFNNCAPKSDFNPSLCKQRVNQWIVGETANTLRAVDAALANYRFNDAANALYDFVWHKVCDWYLEFSKPLLDVEKADIAEETRNTIGWVLDKCFILLHPIMPFITEKLWAMQAKRDVMLIHASWPESDKMVFSYQQDALREIGWVITLIENIRSLRVQLRVPAGAKLRLESQNMSSWAQDVWRENASIIQRMARIELLDKVSEFSKIGARFEIFNDSFALILSDVVDLNAERTRLQEQLEKLENEATKLQARLDNPKFKKSAPEEVVQATEENLHARAQEAQKLRTAFESLG